MTRHADGDFTPDFTPPLYDEHYDEDCDESQNGSVPPSEQGHKTMPKRRGNRRETSLVHSSELGFNGGVRGVQNWDGVESERSYSYDDEQHEHEHEKDEHDAMHASAEGYITINQYLAVLRKKVCVCMCVCMHVCICVCACIHVI
jgi:hypothetical protein